jgi:hypothetical protein
MVSKVYRAALYLYPATFRREFSTEMTRDVHEAMQEVGHGRDRLMLWAGIGADFARTIVVQWLRTGLPVLLLSSAAGALAFAHRLRRVRRVYDDRLGARLV